MNHEVTSISLQSAVTNIAVAHRLGEKTPCVFLHGFGSTKEDFVDARFRREFEGRGLLAFDLPGCGTSSIDRYDVLGVDFIADLTERLLDEYEIDDFHLVGHSMGGLVSLLLSMRLGDRVRSFVNIEGNLTPEDCFFSRRIVERPDPNAEAFLNAFVERLRGEPLYGYGVYCAGLRSKVRTEAVEPFFRSIVDCSDNAPLLERFISLKARKMFVYGEQNRGLSYLDTLRRADVELSEIAFSSHFPMYSNPTQLFDMIGGFISSVDDGSRRTPPPAKSPGF